MPNWPGCSIVPECVLPPKGFQYFLLWQIRRDTLRRSRFLRLFPRNIPRCRVLRCTTACIRLSMPDLCVNLRLRVGICVTILRRKVRTAILYAVRADGYLTCRCPQMSKDSFRPDLPPKVSTSISGAYALNVAVQMAEAAVIRSIIHQHKIN